MKYIPIQFLSDISQQIFYVSGAVVELVISPFSIEYQPVQPCMQSAHSETLYAVWRVLDWIAIQRPLLLPPSN